MEKKVELIRVFTFLEAGQLDPWICRVIVQSSSPEWDTQLIHQLLGECCEAWNPKLLSLIHHTLLDPFFSNNKKLWRTVKSVWECWRKMWIEKERLPKFETLAELELAWLKRENGVFNFKGFWKQRKCVVLKKMDN